MKHDCDICQGRGFVRFPIVPRTPLFVPDADPVIEGATISYRDYPCPECADVIPLEHLSVIDVHSMVRSDIRDHEFVRHARHRLALLLADRMEKTGVIAFEDGPRDPENIAFEMRARVGVASPKTVATLEERVNLRARAIASAMAEEACKRIDHFGSDFGRLAISKEVACRIIRSAASKPSDGAT